MGQALSCAFQQGGALLAGRFSSKAMEHDPVDFNKAGGGAGFPKSASFFQTAGMREGSGCEAQNGRRVGEEADTRGQ